MVLGAVAWVIASAFLHAGWNALVRREPQIRAATIVVMLLATVGALVTAVFRGSPVLSGPALGWSLASALCEGLYVIGLARSLEVAPLGLAYSVSRGTGLLWVWPLAIVFQDEQVTVIGVLASILVLIGVVTAGSRSGAADERSRVGTAGEPAGRTGELKLGRGAGWALLAGIGGGFSNPCIRQALVEGADPLQVFAFSLGLGLIPAVLMLGVGARPLLKLATERWKTLGLAGLLCFGSYALFLIALQSEGAALGTTLRNSSIVFALLLSMWSGEPPTTRQWLGGLAVVTGATLLAFKL